MISNNKGMTLIESLVAVGLVTIVIGMASYSLLQVKQQFKSADKKINSKILLSRYVSLFMAESGHFPPVSRNGLDGFYVYCFDGKGVPQALAGSQRMVEVAFAPDYNVNSNACAGDARFEVRITPKNGAAKLDILDSKSNPIKIIHSESISIPSRY